MQAFGSDGRGRDQAWAGGIILDEQRPDPRMWQVVADGQLIASIERQANVGAALVPVLGAR